MVQHLEQIDNYFQGSMNPDQANAFERLIHDDPAFAQQVAFYLGSVGTLKDQLIADKKVRFREIYDESKMQMVDRLATKPAPVRTFWKYAAAAVIFSAVLVSGYFYTQQPSPAQMADEYIKTSMVNLGAKMNGAADSIEIGKNLNKNQNYAEALVIFENILAGNPTHIEAQEYAGVAALHLNDYDKSLKYFGSLSNIHGLVTNPGTFYMAVTLMKRNLPGDLVKAKALLQNVVKEKLAGHETAAAWLKNL